LRIILSAGFALMALLLASCGDSRSTSQSTDHEEAGYHHTPGVWVTILTQPVTQIVVAPAAATFAVVVDASSGTEVRYQWSANLPGSNLPVSVGENSNQYTTDPTGTTPLLNGTAISVTVTATRDGQSATAISTNADLLLAASGSTTALLLAKAGRDFPIVQNGVCLESNVYQIPITIPESSYLVAAFTWNYTSGIPPTASIESVNLSTGEVLSPISQSPSLEHTSWASYLYASQVNPGSVTLIVQVSQTGCNAFSIALLDYSKVTTASKTIGSSETFAETHELAGWTFSSGQLSLTQNPQLVIAIAETNECESSSRRTPLNNPVLAGSGFTEEYNGLHGCFVVEATNASGTISTPEFYVPGTGASTDGYAVSTAASFQ